MRLVKAAAATDRPSSRNCASPWLDASIARCSTPARDERGQVAMQCRRIGRRQRPGPPARWGYQPERAEACRGVARHRPDFAGEMSDRGLAVGAGDGGDDARLAAVKPRRHKRQPTPRIGVDDDRDSVRALAAGDQVRLRRRSGSPRPRVRPPRRQNARPSKRAPGSAANRKPGRTARESAVMPAMSGLFAGRSPEGGSSAPVSSVSFNALALHALGCQ